MKTIISCGCSYSHGFYWVDFDNLRWNKCKNFSSFTAEKLNAKLINLSIPGASNYLIIKQIEYAINNLNPDLIIFNTTKSDRIDIKIPEKNLDTITFEDYSYSEYIKDIKVPFKNVMHSGPLINFLLKPKYFDITDPKELSRFIVNYDVLVPNSVRSDMNSMMFTHIVCMLKQNKIPYVGIDLGNLLTNRLMKNIISIDIKKFLEQYFCETDTTHFNEHGHKFISNKILDLL